MAAYSSGIETLPELPAFRSGSDSNYGSQKGDSSSLEKDVEREAYPSAIPEDEEGIVPILDKEPVILTGEDVSKYVITSLLDYDVSNWREAIRSLSPIFMIPR
jgi:hypothetical protein